MNLPKDHIAQLTEKLRCLLEGPRIRSELQCLLRSGVTLDAESDTSQGALLNFKTWVIYIPFVCFAPPLPTIQQPPTRDTKHEGLSGVGRASCFMWRVSGCVSSRYQIDATMSHGVELVSPVVNFSESPR